MSKINDSLNEELSLKKQGETRTVVLLTQLQKKMDNQENEVGYDCSFITRFLN